jgi:hypothetical protein
MRIIFKRFYPLNCDIVVIVLLFFEKMYHCLKMTDFRSCQCTSSRCTILHSPFSILHSPSSILHPPSSILHPPSSILHPPSSILHPPSSILPSSAIFVRTSLSSPRPIPKSPFLHRVIISISLLHFQLKQLFVQYH